MREGVASGRGSGALLALLVVGYASRLLWFYLTGFGSIFSQSGLSGVGPIGGESIYFLTGVATLAVIALRPQIVSDGLRYWVVLTAVCTVFGVFLLAFAQGQVDAGSPWVAVAGLVLLGVGYGGSEPVWAEAFGRVLPLSRAGACVAAGYVLCGAACLAAASFADGALLGALSLILPAFSTACWFVFERFSGCGKSARHALPAKNMRFSWVVVVMMLPVALRLVGGGGLWGSAASVSSSPLDISVPSFVAGAVAVAVLVRVGVSWKVGTFSFRKYRAALLLAAMMLLAVSVVDSVGSPGLAFVSDALVWAMEVFCSMLCLVLMLDVARIAGRPEGIVFGIGFGLQWALCFLWSLLAGHVDGITGTIPTVMAFLIVGVFAFLPDQALFSVSSLASRQDDAEGSLAIAAAAFGLTPRETEVLGILAQGRNLRYVGEKLHISESTVKTHTQNIYRKVGVGNRQELLDALQAERDQ
ncbi:response regulator transcription factor [Rubneribacter sp.]